jgi:hypothetical protein
MKTNRLLLGASAVFLSILNPQLLTCFAQGSLTPPGTPTPTMKTLDQVEARKIVNATNTPGDATHLFIISTSGSYYLTGNITGVSGKHGIAISADNVTLDLNGFALVGPGSLNGALSAVVVTSGTARNYTSATVLRKVGEPLESTAQMPATASSITSESRIVAADSNAAAQTR